MSRRPSPSPADLLGDPGVLEPAPTLEVFGSRAVEAVGGNALLPHRGEYLRARGQGVDACGWFDGTPNDRFTQAVVHLQKGRAATEEGLAEAWDRLDPGGRLLLAGGNDLGIKSAVKRFTAKIGEPAETLSNRARARVACWPRTDASIPAPVIDDIDVSTVFDEFTLHSRPGVFSADGVDPGTALLLGHLERAETPECVFDPGCGLGVLGLAALRRWPDATAVFADVDYRAVDCAQRNAESLGLDHRCKTVWWDAVSEPPPLKHCDLVLLNPPFHSGVPVDLQPARSIFKAINAVLSTGGRALIVANRTLPWENDLRELGRLSQLEDARGYKVMELIR